MNHFNDHLNYCNNIHDNLFVRNQVQYYKNLSEKLERKYNQLLNEVESPFRVDSPLSAGGVGDDPNTRNIAGVEAAGLSARQSTAFDPMSPIWDIKWKIDTGGAGYDWGSILNGFYLNWNNPHWWDTYGIELAACLFPLSALNWGWSNGVVVPLLTESQKQTTWNAIIGMMQAGSQANSQYNASEAAWNVLQNIANQNGGRGHGVPFSYFNPSNTNYWFNGQGLPGLPTPPWQWNSSQGLPFHKATPPGFYTGNVQSSGGRNDAQASGSGEDVGFQTAQGGPGMGSGGRPWWVFGPQRDPNVGTPRPPRAPRAPRGPRQPEPPQAPRPPRR